MGLFSVFKSKKSKLDLPLADELDVPPTPPSLEDMPSLNTNINDDLEAEKPIISPKIPKFEAPKEEIPTPIPQESQDLPLFPSTKLVTVPT